MAGLVPAIHVLQYLCMAGGYIYFMTNRANGILYVGVTNDLVRRVFEHRSGFVKGLTKKYGLKTSSTSRGSRRSRMRSSASTISSIGRAPGKFV
jgi:GIY-YIG catalytic domain-containing protein